MRSGEHASHDDAHLERRARGGEVARVRAECLEPPERRDTKELRQLHELRELLGHRIAGVVDEDCARRAGA